jgi:pimeloyl-ACP methyl ester carboxylesterase
MVKSRVAFLLGLMIAACAPARLDRSALKPESPAERRDDLTRALGGANDEHAVRNLGLWLATAPPEGATVNGIAVRFHPGSDSIYSRHHFERLEPAFRYDVEGLPHHQGRGLGVPMVGYRTNRHREPNERWYSDKLITRAVTAVAIPSRTQDGERSVEIRLYNRHKTESIAMAGHRQTLAFDFSVPWAAQFEKARPLNEVGFFSAFRWKAPLESGFILTEDYDPRRTPVICIHGLFSTSLAWAELTNEIWADPTLRQRYQVWHYLYPTNTPALYSSMMLRRQLDELRRSLDPEGNDPAMKRTVVVAHSLGGLLAKSLVVKPADAFWDAFFTRPIGSLNLSSYERQTLEDAFFWKPCPHVDRVIFCSVPFRGSTWAKSWVGKLGTHLVVEENRFQRFFRSVERKNPGLIRPEYRSLAENKITSVATLTPEDRSTEVFGSLPLTRGTASHVIAGSRDLVVPPSSTRVPGAESFIKVPSGHGSFDDPKAIAEILRVLALPPAR